MNEDMIIEMLIKHDSDIQWIKENMATKKDLERIYTSLDEILLLVKKNDQEVTFMNQRVTRLELRYDT